jgi:hypothetical protein
LPASAAESAAGGWVGTRLPGPARMLTLRSLLHSGVAGCRRRGGWRSGRGGDGSRPVCRSAAARLGWPARRNAPTARLRRLAITRGRLPLRAVEASSPKVTSRTQGSRFSILQCPRSQPANWAGLALPRARLVTA